MSCVIRIGYHYFRKNLKSKYFMSPKNEAVVAFYTEIFMYCGNVIFFSKS